MDYIAIKEDLELAFIILQTFTCWQESYRNAITK